MTSVFLSIRNVLSGLKSRSNMIFGWPKVSVKSSLLRRKLFDSWKPAGQHAFVPPSPCLHAYPRCSSVHMHTREPHSSWPKSGRLFFRWFLLLFLGVCLFAFFKLGTTDLSSICTPSSPWKTFQRAGRKAPVQLKATPLLFLGGLDWFAPKWLQPVSDSTGSSSGLVLTRWRADTCWQRVPLFQRVESVLNSDSSSHCIVLSMSQGFLAEIRAVFKIRK